MSELQTRPDADPLFGRPSPRRPAYATGVLLDAEDFLDEQTYHRNALARAVAGLSGSGTLAGMRVTHRPPEAGVEEEVRVESGLVVDRLGRLVELRRPACLRLGRWWEATAGDDGGDALTTATYADPGRFLSSRAAAEAGSAGLPALPERAVVADVFVRFVACAEGYTPSFGQGPYDALDAVVTSRLRDAYELSLVPRPGLDDDFDGLPARGGDLVGIVDPADRRAALQDRILDAWTGTGRAGEEGGLAPLEEHVVGMDPTAQFLARVLLPVTADEPPERDGAAVVVDNWSRRFVSSTRLLQDWLGI
jgi:hypothetical protein